MTENGSRATAERPDQTQFPVSDRPTAQATRQRLVEWIQTYTDRTDANGVVVNLSGGLDSTVTATLAVEALGADSVFGLVLPSNKLGAHAAQDAEAVADTLGIRHETAHVQPLLARAADMAPDTVDLHGDPIARGNLTARMRMAMAYLTANATERLVIGTTNRSELLLGYFTKYGDGGVDFLPLGDCYKTEVRALARELDVPEPILKKPASAGFWPGQSDQRDLGVSYAVIDAVLYRLVERGENRADIEADLDADPEAIDRVLRHYDATGHKRAFPPTPATDPTPPITDQ